MATTIDTRTAITFTFPDDAVTYSGGGANVDLSSAAIGGGLLAENNLSDVDSAADARTNLGGTATGIALFTAASAAAAQTAIGATVTGSSLIVAADASAAQTAIGATVTGAALITAASVAAARGTLSVNVHAIVVQAYVAVTTAGVLYVDVPADVSGTVTSIVATNSADPGGNLVITPAIGPSGGAFVAITDGGITVANTTAAGTKTSSTPSAANTVTGGTSVIEVAWDNGAANACNVTVSIYVTRT